MSLASVCRVCLSVGRLELIANTQLQTIFEKLTSNQLITGDGRPESVCYMCHRLLQKCCKFVHLSHRAEKTFSQLLYSRIELNQKNLTIKCSTNQNDSPTALTVSTTTYMAIPSENELEGSQALIKSELEEKKSIVKSDTDHADSTGSLDRSMKIVKFGQILNSSNSSKDLVVISIMTKQSKKFRKLDNDINESAKLTKPKKKYKPRKIKRKLIKGLTYNCEKCSKTFTYKGGLRQHATTHSDTKPFTCPDCPKAFTSKPHLKAHMNIHTGERPHACHICAKTFIRHTYLTRHIKTHTGEKPYTCHICSKPFIEKAKLQDHIRTHTGERPYACKICPKKFGNLSTLKVHTKRIHSGEKTYACFVCSKKFFTSDDLKIHMRSHTGERPYLCDKCPAAFSHKQNFHAHKTTHTGEKPYACHICAKTFSQKRCLKQHMITHSGERPYHTCDHCSQTFKRKQHLKKHISTLHIKN